MVQSKAVKILSLGILGALIGPISAQSSASRQPDLGNLERQAASNLLAGKTGLAIEELKAALANKPESAEARSNLGLAYYMERRFAEAANEFEIVLRSTTGQWKIAGLCGLSEARVGKNPQALDHLKQAFPHIEEPELRIAVGKQLFDLRFQSGDFPGASSIVEELKILDPKNPDVLYAAHQVYSKLESRSFLELANLDPQSARIFQVRADRLAQRGNLEGAIATYRVAISKDPHLSGVHFALGEALRVSQNASERSLAESEYLKSLADNPSDEKSECRLGDISLQENLLAAARKHFDRAIALQPDDADANEGLGLVLFGSNMPHEASVYLKRAIELDPTNVVAYYHLSQADRQAGQLDEARSEMAEFLRLKAERDHLNRSFDDLQSQIRTLDESAPHDVHHAN